MLRTIQGDAKKEASSSSGSKKRQQNTDDDKFQQQFSQEVTATRGCPWMVIPSQAKGTREGGVDRVLSCLLSRPLLSLSFVRSHSSIACRVKAAFWGGMCPRFGLPRFCRKRLLGGLASGRACNSLTAWCNASSVTSLERVTFWLM